METKEEKRATFTPGPWHAHGTRVSTWETQDEIDFHGDEVIAETGFNANARLIAAAPELLDALKNVKRALRMPVSLEAIRLLVDEAIHKAEVEVEGGEG